MKLRIKEIIKLLSEFFILTIIFLIPTYFALLPRGANVFELPKMILFKILALLLLLFTVIKFLLLLSQKRGVFTKNFRIIIFKKNSLVLILFFFLLVLSFSALLSPWSELSFYGTYDRQIGLSSYIYFLLFFFLLLVNIKTRAQIKRIIKAAVFGSVAVCAYGLVQAAGHDPLHWIESTRLRVTSTFGQPNILAAYLLLIIPLSVYLIWQTKRWWAKVIYFLILTGQLLTLFFTYSFSGWLGLVAGMIIGGIIFLLFYSRKTWKNDIKSPLKRDGSDVSQRRSVLYFLKKKTAKLILFFFLLLIPLIFGFNLYKHQPFVLQSKIYYLFRPSAGSLGARADFWRASLTAIKKRPLFGYGPDTQGEALLSYYEKDWATVNKANVRPNRAHNLFLDILLTGGVLGLTAFLALLYVFLKLLWQNIKDNNNRVLNIAIFFSLLSYLIYLMFNFSSVTTEIYFWLYFALVAAMSGVSPGKQTIKTPISAGQKSLSADKTFFWRYILIGIKIILTITIAGGVLWQANREVKALVADHYWYAVRNVRWVDNDFFASWVLFSYIKDLNIKNDYYQRQYALMLANWVPELDQYGAIFRRAAEEKILPEILPILKTGQTYNDYLIRGKVYTLLASPKKPKYYQLARNNLEKLINISPNRPRPYIELAQFLTKKENYNRAEKNYRLALTKLPNFDNPRLDANHAKDIKQEMHLIYYGLGELYFKKGDYQQAIKYYQLAQNYNKYDLSVLRSLAQAYYRQGDIEQSIRYNKKGEEATPDYDWSWPLALARLYDELDEKKQARQYAQKVLKFYPNNWEMKKLLEKN